ncbi:MAG: class I SAM-dependent methyltransferase [Verrucomicrobia bacterium]|nr:MAG: class I SAM-dependent methyltransferase [Verrucomicrobiota bacterium]
MPHWSGCNLLGMTSGWVNHLYSNLSTPRYAAAVTAALETLMLAFTGENALAVPASAMFLGAQAHPALAAWPMLRGWQPLKPLAATWERAGLARVEQAAGRFPLVLVLPGKSRDETLGWFGLARELLEPGGRLLAAMPNTAGASRFEKTLANACGNITSLQKHKCRAFYAVEDGQWDEQVFAQWRELGRRRLIPNMPFAVEPGMFSVDHIDPGSALLAARLPETLRGNVADLGAGWGFLSDTVLRRCPKVARIDLFEADARALDCARANLAGHAREILFHWHDVCTGLPGSYDAIVMNPPFHTGQATDVDLGRAFLKTAAAALKPGGKLFLVANRQLAYEAALEAAGLVWHNAGEDPTYKLLFAQRR